MLFKINIIDDEKNLNDLVRTYLEKEGVGLLREGTPIKVKQN